MSRESLLAALETHNQRGAPEHIPLNFLVRGVADLQDALKALEDGADVPPDFREQLASAKKLIEFGDGRLEPAVQSALRAYIDNHLELIETLDQIAG